MTASSKLPEGWCSTTLGELGKWSSGGTPKRGNPEYYDGGSIPWVKTGDLDDGELLVVPESITEKGLKNSSAKLFPEGTLLVAMYGATIGKLAILGIEAATNQACAALLPFGLTKDLIPYLFWYLKERREDLRAVGQGGAQPNISQTVLKAYPCPLPPLNEQRRIVAKIEELTARSRNAKQALDAIPPLLERFRQSVLAAAFRGDLTKQWRQQNPNTEPASELLKRIRQERRHRWGQDYLQTQKVKGKQPKNDKWKEKYEEPEPVDTTDLPELPEGWCWAQVDTLVADTQLGLVRSSKQQTTSGDVPYIRMQHFDFSGNWNFNDLTYIKASPLEREKFALRDGDVLFNTRNSRELVGKVGLWREAIEGALFNNNLMRLRFSDLVHGGFIAFQMQSPGYRQRISPFKSATTSVAAIYARDLIRQPLAVPPLREQTEILQKLESLFEFLQTATELVERNLIKLGLLDRSVLAKAFRGELVPQDPNDEPASALVERLKLEERAAGKK